MKKLLNIIICILLPPLAVFLKNGVGKDLFLNIVLSIFFFVPGVIHALWATTK
ncbi:YqaE/Pmp3 family membrane protein [Psychromonas ossibalaenae]|uniref:YqaE/Pmp3 family membrane protein n=1 Tax=Psychromonas ossibalaenae TaxID=444922 RepID=UPI0003664E69|nr:YqaE/Pmp3 family membrane protein [Psychromonas ossibalaenae]